MIQSFCAFSFIFFAAIEPYTERGTIDFDVIVEELKDHGQWQPHETYRFVFVPSEKDADWTPYRNGQWFYTDFGWTWKGAGPVSWAVDHYGFWTKSAIGKWAWTPNSTWLSATVEWLQSGDYVGWRPSHLDRFSNPVESATARYSDPGEWNFIPRAKLKGPLKSDDYMDLKLAEKLLIDARPVDHIFKTYRDIGRPGPNPFVLAEDGTQPSIPVLRMLPDLLHRPENSTERDYFVFRPVFFQDDDGIMNRIKAFLCPTQENAADGEVGHTLTR
jgi:hypothetical protein